MRAKREFALVLVSEKTNFINSHLITFISSSRNIFWWLDNVTMKYTGCYKTWLVFIPFFFHKLLQISVCGNFGIDTTFLIKILFLMDMLCIMQRQHMLESGNLFFHVSLSQLLKLRSIQHHFLTNVCMKREPSLPHTKMKTLLLEIL